MKKEAKWFYSRCVSLVLAELAKKPGTPIDIKTRTGLTKNNYVNIILKKLESKGIVKCLNPDEKIGKVFCINPASAGRVKKIFEEMKGKQEINPLPDLNWRAYGILLCKGFGKQIRIVFKEAYRLGNEMVFENDFKKRITIPVLQKEKLPKMATSDLHRAFNRLVELGLMKRKHSWPREYSLTENARKIIEFDSNVIQ